MSINHSFPVTLPNHWLGQNEIVVPNAYLRNWLLDTGSLTERLQSHCHQFDLTLLGQRQISPELEEIQQIRHYVGDNIDPQWQVREVILNGNQQPWVFARSVISHGLCEGDFAGLGNRPLGQIIFNDPKFKRHPFQIMRIAPNDPLHRKLSIEQDKALWGRRSVFSYGGHALMVAEVFLPSSPAYQKMDPIEYV